MATGRDLGGPDEICEWCPYNKRIRFVHVMSHPDWRDLVRVGKDCGELMDPGARPRTEGSSAKEEGEVHRALPPPQRRSAPGGVPRAQARRRPWDGRADVAGLCGRP